MMRTKSYKFYYICGFIYPYKQKIVLNMTLQATLIHPM